MLQISPYCILCITKAEVDLMFGDTAKPKVRELRLTALRELPSYLLAYSNDNMSQKLIDAVCEKKIAFIMKAETLREVRGIMRPAHPERTYNGIVCNSPYHIPEEELMLWAHISPNNMLIPEAMERYLALFKQVYDMSVKEYLEEQHER